MRRLIPIACNQVLTLIFGMISLKLISRLVPPEVNGLYSLVLTLACTSVILSHAGLYNHAVRYWQREHARQGEYARFLWHMNLRASVELAVVLLVMTAAMSIFHQNMEWLVMFPLLLVTNLGLSTFAVASGVLNVDDRRWTVCSLGVVGGVFRALLPAGFAWLAGASLLSLAGGFTLYTVLLAAATLWVFRPLWSAPPVQTAHEKQWLQEMKDYGRPYFWMGLGGWCLQFADRWVVYGFFGKDASGQFATASSLAVIIPGMAAMALLQLVMPKVFRRADEAKTLGDWHDLARHCDLLTGAFLVICLVGFGVLEFVGPHLVGWLIDPKYGPAIPLLVPVGLAAVSVQVNQFHYLLLQGQHDSIGMVKVMLVVAGVKTVGSIFAAWISWECFLAWLMISVLFSTVLGRCLIRAAVFRRAANGGVAAVPEGAK